jgi:hypothetical protein
MHITHLYFQFQKAITSIIRTFFYHNKLHYVHVEVYNLKKIIIYQLQFVQNDMAIRMTPKK